MDGGDVCAYLDTNKIEAEITAAVAACVEQGAAQPLAYLAKRLAERAAEVALEFDYKSLCAELKALVRSHKCAKELVRLSWHDAGTYSVVLGGGGPNAAMRFQEGGEAGFEANEGLDGTIALLAPLKTRHPNISHADLWALAANVAVEELGGPAVATRFGRIDADSATDSVEGQPGRLPTEKSAVHLRDLFYAKGFNDREIVALSTFALVEDFGLAEDAGFAPWVEAFAADQPKLASDFAEAWAKLQELGCGRLMPHPASLEHAAPGCQLPTVWLDLPLLAKREHNHDSTIYAFELPNKAASLGLPACAAVHLRVPGRGRGGGGADDFDGSDAARPYSPISSGEMHGRFELLVTRLAGGVVSHWLHGLPLGSKVGFKLPRAEVRPEVQYPFAGVKTFSLLCTESGLPPMYQLLCTLLSAPSEEREVVLLCHSATVDDILLREELEELARKAEGRFKLVHVVGTQPDELPPPGWEDTATHTAAAGTLDRAKIQTYAFPPAADTRLFVCGQPKTYAALCGAREEPGLRKSSLLHELGYTGSMVVKM